jgi:hypothetical protein
MSGVQDMKITICRLLKLDVYRRALHLLIFVLPVVFLPACSPIGPNTIARDRFEYTDAISESWKRQMLLNIVKIRYADAPVFLEVSSVISQYAIETEFSVSPRFDARNSQTFFGRGKHTDRPTITYNPLTGEKFTREILTPIPTTAILILIQGGWPIDRVLGICVKSINRIDNRAGSPAFLREADPEFYQLTSELRAIQQQGGVGVRIEQKEGKVTSIILFEHGDDEKMKQRLSRLKELLNLSPDTNEFILISGRTPRSGTELAIQSRSLMEIMLELSTYIDVPQKDLDEGRILPTLHLAVEENAGILPPIRIYSSKNVPADAYLSVRYRDHWFYIDDRNPRSKGMLMFVMILFSFAETGGPSAAPIVTIPAG